MSRLDMLSLWLFMLLCFVEKVQLNELMFVIPSLNNAATLSIETLHPITNVDVDINGERGVISNQDNRRLTISLTFDGGIDIIEGINRMRTTYLKLTCPQCEANILASARLKYEGYSPMTVYPSESLANEYKIVTYCQILGSCFAMIASDSDTVLTAITISVVPGSNIVLDNWDCDEAICEITLDQGDMAMIKCHQCDLTGMTIKSNAKLAVFVGGNNTVVRTGKTSTSFMSQMTPVTKWGREYLLISPDINNMGDIVRIIARFNDTIVRMDGYPHARILDNVIMQRVLNYGSITHVSANQPIVVVQMVSDGNGSSAMVIVPPTDQYFEDSFYVACGGASKTVLVTSIKETTASNKIEARIGVSEYHAVSELDDSCGNHTGSVKGLIFMVSSERPTDISYYARLDIKDVLITKPAVPGDEVDNDNDGLVDEDDCGFSIKYGGCLSTNNGMIEVAHLDTKEKYNKAKGFLQSAVVWRSDRLKISENTVSEEWKSSYVLRRTHLVIMLATYRWQKVWDHNDWYLCVDIEEGGDTCSPGSYQKKDHIGYRFVFPVFHVPSSNIEMETMISTLKDDTYFHMDHFISGQLFNRIRTHWEGKESTSYNDNYDDRLQTYHISSYMDLTITIILNVDGKKSSMLMYPVDVWGLEYYAASYCSGRCSSFCLITAAYDNTTVTVLFPSFDVPPAVYVRSLEGTQTINTPMLTHELQNNTFIQISSEVDLTGANIKGNNPIAVICGALTNTYLISEQMIPVKFLQAGPYNDVFLPVDTVMEQKIRVMATNTLTKCNLTTTSTSIAESFSSNFMLTMYGQFYEINNNEYYTETNVHIRCDRPVLVWGVHIGFDNDALMVLYYTGHDGSMMPWQYDREDVYKTFSGMSFIENEVCILGEGEDSDCDGQTKEEYCVLSGYNFFPEKYLLEDGKFIPDYDFDGQYDEDCITILPDCGMPNISNGEVYNFNEWTNTHVTAALSDFGCHEGYTAILPITEMTCYANGSWYPTLECKKDCQDPTDNYDNSVIKTNGSWVSNSTVVMSCDTERGYVLQGINVLTCEEGGTWTQDMFFCIEGCEDPTNITNNSLPRYPDRPRAQGSRHEMVCGEGYSVKGDAFMQCLNGSIWSQPEFTCVQSCSDPRLASEFSYIPRYVDGTPFLEGTTVNVKCNSSSTLVGNGKMTCLPKRKWSSSYKCIKHCPDPRNVFDFPNAYLRRFNKDSSTAYGITYQFRCRLFYTLYGNGQISCLENSTWNAVNITCKTCKCLCRKRGNPRYDNITEGVENTIKEELKSELQVEKTTVSAAVAKKVSAKDERKSSQSIGALGIVLFSLVIGSIISFDLINVYFFFKGNNSNAVAST